MVVQQDDYALALEYLRLLAQQRFGELWRAGGVGRLTRSEVRDAFAELTVAFGEQAAAAAVDYLVLSRSLDEELAGLAFPDQADPVKYGHALASYDWALNTSMNAGVFDAVGARVKLDGILARVVSAQASGTIVRNVMRDGTAFARVPEPGACSFCLMLASRGAVYTAKTVGAVNKFHDHCRCLGVEVKRDGSDLPRINRDLEQLWSDLKSSTQADFEKALNTRREFGVVGQPRNTRVYRLPDDSARESIVRWQGMDRFYVQVQKAADGVNDDPEALKVLDELDVAARRTPLQRDVLMWRGVRNWQAAFGLESLKEIATYDKEQARFTAISSDRKVAEEEFTTFDKAGALLKITARKGTPGIWMPANGSDSHELIRQQEFLVPPGARIRVVSVRNGELPIIEVELLNE